MYDILLGRTEADRQKYGETGNVLVGRHYVKMGTAISLSNSVFLDVLRSHVVFICGKRGSGKSYTLGVVAEGMAELPANLRNNLAFLFIDTMGIYWTMKFPNRRERESLSQWGLAPKGFPVRLLVPGGVEAKMRAQGVPADGAFVVNPADLRPSEWLLAFDLKETDMLGVLISKVIFDMLEAGQYYGIAEIVAAVDRDLDFSLEVRRAARARFLQAAQWGIFAKEGTALQDLVAPGQTTVLDLSNFATTDAGWNVKALVIGLVANKLFASRITARRAEEVAELAATLRYARAEERKQEPLVWVAIDEAHEFLPAQGRTAATDPLVTLLREGRQPGISLLLASQQPGKIHTDVLTQADIVIAHRLTAKVDTDALQSLVQSYMRTGLDVALNELPREKGAAVILDDTNEKVYPVRIRPRLSWHGGESPVAAPEEKRPFE